MKVNTDDLWLHWRWNCRFQSPGLRIDSCFRDSIIASDRLMRIVTVQILKCIVLYATWRDEMCLAIDWKETVLLLSLFIWYLLLLRNFKSAPVQESINKEEPKRCHILVSNDPALFWCYFDWEMSEPLWSSVHSGHTGIRSLAVENMFVLTLWFVSAADIPYLRICKCEAVACSIILSFSPSKEVVLVISWRSLKHWYQLVWHFGLV